MIQKSTPTVGFAVTGGLLLSAEYEVLEERPFNSESGGSETLVGRVFLSVPTVVLVVSRMLPVEALVGPSALEPFVDTVSSTAVSVPG